MCFVFFFQAEDGIRDVAVTGVQTCALPISLSGKALVRVACAEFPERGMPRGTLAGLCVGAGRNQPTLHDFLQETDRKSTRLNSSHGYISYAVFCLKKKQKQNVAFRRFVCAA